MGLVWAEGVDADKANASVNDFLGGVSVKKGMRKVHVSPPMSRPVCAKEEDCVRFCGLGYGLLVRGEYLPCYPLAWSKRCQLYDYRGTDALGEWDLIHCVA